MIIKKVINRLFVMPLIKLKMKQCGTNVRIGLSSNSNWNNCFIGNDVYIGPNALMMCTNAPIYIGSHVAIGPNVTIITGNHRFNVVGKFITDVNDNMKLSDDDVPVVIKDDCWIGANVTILKGVTIGRGSIIGAGSVVTRNVDNYQVVAGVPAKK